MHTWCNTVLKLCGTIHGKETYRSFEQLGPESRAEIIKDFSPGTNTVTSFDSPETWSVHRYTPVCCQLTFNKVRSLDLLPFCTTSYHLPTFCSWSTWKFGTSSFLNSQRVSPKPEQVRVRVDPCTRTSSLSSGMIFRHVAPVRRHRRAGVDTTQEKKGQAGGRKENRMGLKVKSTIRILFWPLNDDGYELSAVRSWRIMIPPWRQMCLIWNTKVNYQCSIFIGLLNHRRCCRFILYIYIFECLTSHCQTDLEHCHSPHVWFLQILNPAGERRENNQSSLCCHIFHISFVKIKSESDYKVPHYSTVAVISSRKTLAGVRKNKSHLHIRRICFPSGETTQNYSVLPSLKGNKHNTFGPVVKRPFFNGFWPGRPVWGPDAVHSEGIWCLSAPGQSDNVWLPLSPVHQQPEH